MGKCRRLLFILSLILLILLMAGCSKKGVGNKNLIISSNIDTNSYEIESEAEYKTTEVSSISHKLANPNVDTNGILKPLRYSGGEISIDYEVNSSGMVTNYGFLIFIDGIPQPYKFNSSKASYEYMHELQLEDGKDTKITFIFNPITGKKGDSLDLCIASILNPSFIPDMKKTMSYGNYHSILPAFYTLVFDQEAKKLDNNMSRYNYLNNVNTSKEMLADEQKEKDNANNQVFTELYMNDTNMEYSNKLILHKNKTIHLTYKIFGHPGIKYRNIIYVNNYPITSKDVFSFETVLKKGDVMVVDADMDVSKLDGQNTFYIISVPCNVRNYANNIMEFKKSPSILLCFD